VYNSLPRGLRRLVGHGLENLDDQTEGFIDFEQRLDWTFGMVEHEGKRQTAEGMTQAWKKFPWTIARQMMRLRQHGINISSRGRRQCKLSICLEE
jgi:hypothetical protein